MDAIAVSLAGGGTYVGIAPLGTSFTEAQALKLKPYVGDDPSRIVIATDPDAAGWQAAQKAFWRLAAVRANPRHLALPDGVDPADVLRDAGAAALAARLGDTSEFAGVLTDRLIERRLPGHTDAFARVDLAREVARIIGALPPDRWLELAQQLAERLDLTLPTIHEEIYDRGARWTETPEACATRELASLRPVAPPAVRARVAEEPSITEPATVDAEVAIGRYFETGIDR